MLDQARTRPSPFDEETDNKPITVEASVVGCCNGLFCLVKYGRYFLWNPATKIFFKLPKIPPTDSYPYVKRKRGFSWDETTGAYKVFALSSDPDRNNKRVARVYSSNTNSWTTVDHGSLSLYNEVGFYACGNLHWLTESGDRMVRIESFDLKSETFGKIEMPPGGGEVQAYGVNRLRLGEVRGCLSVMRKLWRGGADVWVMKEHGSWQKFFLIRDYHCRSQRCVSLPCGEVLLICGRNVFSVCSGVVKRKKVSRYERWRSSVKGLLTGWYEGCYNCMDVSLDLDAYDTFLYVESLVTPLPH